MTTSTTPPLPTSIDPLLATLAELKGQDLHLTAGAAPSVRVDGELIRLSYPALRPADIVELVTPMLTQQQKDTFTKQRELDFAIADARGRYRCNLYQQRGSLAFTARRIVEVVPTAKELGLPSFLADFALKPQGLVLVVGPNGHGKSTTLAWMIDHINAHRKANIITIEDPIEFHFEHKLSNVNQREVGTDTASFAEGVHRVVRQNPDVIVIGELRDYDSIATAVSAAQTGHLVLGTLHTVNATATIDRLIEFFPANEQALARSELAESLQLIFSQRLLKRAQGKGRVMVWEKVATSPRVKTAIRDGRAAQLRTLMQSVHDDLVPMDRNIAEAILHHVVAKDEGLRYAENPQYVEDIMKAITDAKKESR